MNNRRQILAVMILVITALNISFAQIDKAVQSALEEKELNPQIYLDAKTEAINLNIPIKIILDERSFIEILRIKNGTIQYCLINNFAQPLEGAELLTYSQIATRFDLSKAIVIYGNSGAMKEPTYQYPNGRTPSKLFLVPDWTADKVLAFDFQTGNIVNENFIPTNNPNLQSPKEALYNPAGFISISDQISDLVQKYDTSGNYLGIYAPAGGANPTILDNIRGHNYRPNNGNLVVAVGSSGNQNAVAEFDALGNYVGNFIAIGAGGLNSPFGITFRPNDVLVSGSSSDAVHRYDLSGNYLDNFASSIQFPQQVTLLPNGNVAVAVFSVPSGIAIYNSSGTQLSFWTQVTGNRGIAQLGSGNFITTNGGGIHELDTAGNLVRTILAAANLQYISLVDFGNVIPVELASFTASIINNTTELQWKTSSEKNNRGFDIERKLISRQNAAGNWESIGFVNGAGTTTHEQNYSFTDENIFGDRILYRLKQIDFDGSFNYSHEVEVDVATPNDYSLAQNFPNPFNPSTTISFSLPEKAAVSLNIYNSLGEFVTSVITSEEKDAGFYRINFDAAKLTSGSYIYQLKANSDSKSFIASKKMLVIK